MGTVVNLLVGGTRGTDARMNAQRTAVHRAAEWFRQIERSCNRFDSNSEVRLLATCAGTAVAVSPTLFEAVRFALAVAEDTDGAFDPTIGQHMETLGFTRDYRSGADCGSRLATSASTSFRDVELHTESQSITLHQPLLLDLGAVAKGLAIDMAARELHPFENFLIDAGGDVYAGGETPNGGPWAIGIRHPRETDRLLRTVHVSGVAVCTSGDYERRSPTTGQHHIVHAATRSGANMVSSATVLAQSAMVADALATAAFSLGPDAGLDLLQRHEIEGLIVTASLQECATPGMPRD
ncbi:MAG: FAD:protein FMN transferase [Gemmatimonadota bacterium]|nr:FAD:protein FMN transferase [Gemmatimonadota bacterium]